MLGIDIEKYTAQTLENAKASKLALLDKYDILGTAYCMAVRFRKERNGVFLANLVLNALPGNEFLTAQLFLQVPVSRQESDPNWEKAVADYNQMFLGLGLQLPALERVFQNVRSNLNINPSIRTNNRPKSQDFYITPNLSYEQNILERPNDLTMAQVQDLQKNFGVGLIPFSWGAWMADNYPRIKD